MKKSTLWAVCVTAVLIFGVLQVGWTQVNISSGNTAAENFDGIGVAAIATLPTGWKADKNVTARTLGLYSAAVTATEQRAGNAMSTTAANGIYNYAAGDPAVATDRAVGGISSGSASKSVNVYVQLFNNGASVINQLTISYNVEKYRKGSNTAGFSIQMYYSTDGIAWTSAGANFLTSFAADADNTGYTPAPGATVAVTSQALVQSIPVSGNFYLAWNYAVTSGTTTSNAQALGIDDVSITGDATASIVQSPFFTPAAGNYFSPQNVTIASNTTGTDIYYTTDGTDPSNSPLNGTLYTSPVPVSTTTTIKAKAYKTGMTSSGISSAFYQFPIDVANIAALRAGVVGSTVYRLTGEALVTYQRPDANRNQMYIQDATAAIVVDDVMGIIASNDYNFGDGVTGLTGTLYNFNSLLEFVPLLDPGAPTTTGNSITPLAKTLATLTTNDQAKLVSIPVVSFSAPTGNFVVSTDYTITDPSGPGTFRALFVESDYIGTPIPTTPQNMIALVGQVGAVINITPRLLSDMTPFTPSWTSGWPKAENASQTVFNAKVNIDVPGTAYYVVLPNGDPAPTSAQVKLGQNAAGTTVAANLAGTIVCAAGGTEYTDGVTGLTPSTTYNVYFVAEAYTNLQAVPVMKIITTTTGGTAPVIINPTATGMTDISAVLGGEITSDGGSALTERGTVWKSTPGVTIADHKQIAGGTAIGIFTDTRTGFTPASLIYYAAYATNAMGLTTLTSESSFYTLAIEPSNHATAFSAGTTTTTTIPLTWTDAGSGVLPTAYLIKGSSVSYADITDPADGTPVANSALIQNVNQGVGTFTFTGLSAGIPYYFKIYPYTGSLATINYKTSPAAPTATATTVSAAYTWNGADNGDWAVPTNWSPTRTSPAAVDILQFNDGTTKTVTGVPAAETIGQLVVSGTNTIVNLQSSAAAVLTIAGLAGTDLVVSTGCALNLNGTGAITLALSATATGSFDGSMTFSSTATTAHRLIPAAANSIYFHNGASFTAGTFFGGNPFGTASTLNSIIFESGSTYYHQSGSNPFGATQPSSIVIFQTGSLYKVIGSVTPGYSGRTYANLEYDYPTGIFTQTGSAKVTMDNLTITNGTVNFGVTGTSGHSIKGNIIVASGAVLNFNPNASGTPAAGTVNFNGLTAQTISGDGTIKGTTFSTIVINNGNGVTLNANDTINGTLTLTSGLLTLDEGNLTFGATAIFTGTPSATNMIVATNAGELRKIFSASSGSTGNSYTFPVGDNTGTAEYSPVTLSFTSGAFTTSYEAGVNLRNSTYLGLGSSVNNLSRFWNVTSTGITAFTCDAQFNYVPADVIGSESGIYCILVSPPTNYSPANIGGHYLTATGVTTFGTFTGRDPFSSDKTVTLTSLFLEGLYRASTSTDPLDIPGQMIQAKDKVAGSIVPKFGAGIADQITVVLHDAACSVGNPLVVATIPNVNLSVTGTATFTVPGTINGNYYITIQHRNSVETTTKLPQSFAGASVNYDFSSKTQAFGDYMKSITGTIPKDCIFTGDFTGGGAYPSVQIQDLAVGVRDMTDLENKSKIFAGGYILEDINGDGGAGVKDMTLIENNAKLFVTAKLPY